MTRIKVVPLAQPNNEGFWIECPFEVPPSTRWRHMEAMVSQVVPAGHTVVAVEAGSRSRAPISTGVVPFKK